MIAHVVTATDYWQVFKAEREQTYPTVDAFEQKMGFAVNPQRLVDAARVLACPVKKNPPNWQHGRVIYAAARQYFSSRLDSMRIVDIGTAKGFSALCLLWALQDAGINGRVWSVDVIDPHARVRRNTVAEVDGFKTLAETLAPWPETRNISFSKMTGVEYLSAEKFKINVAFIDGKHSHDVVLQEGRMLAARQDPGDLAIFDDLQLIGSAVDQLESENLYSFTRLSVTKHRGYAIGVRRG